MLPAKLGILRDCASDHQVDTKVGHQEICKVPNCPAVTLSLTLVCRMSWNISKSCSNHVDETSRVEVLPGAGADDGVDLYAFSDSAPWLSGEAAELVRECSL